jgi:hypothetical protein
MSNAIVQSWLANLDGIYINNLTSFFSYEGELYIDEVSDEFSNTASMYTSQFSSVVESNGGKVGFSV